MFAFRPSGPHQRSRSGADAGGQALRLENVGPIDCPPMVVVGLGFAEEAIAASWVDRVTTTGAYVARTVGERSALTSFDFHLGSPCF